MPCCWKTSVFCFPLSTPHPLLPAVPAEKRKLTTFTSCGIADTEAFLFQPVGNIGKTNARPPTRERCAEKQRPYQQEDGRCFEQRKWDFAVNELCASAYAFAASGQTDAAFPLPSVPCSVVCVRFWIPPTATVKPAVILSRHRCSATAFLRFSVCVSDCQQPALR